MSGVRLCNSRLQNEDALKYYVNVYIHCENNSIVEAHMMVLAQHSPFCHRFFMSRKEIKVADMFFTTMKHSIVEAAVAVIYGKTVSLGDSDFKRVCSFLRMLQVEYEILPSDVETCQEEDAGNRTFDIKTLERPTTVFASPMQKTDAQNILPEQPAMREEEDLDNWTMTTESTRRVFSIDHNAERLEEQKKTKYICKHCQETCFAFQKAENHYFNKHLAIQEITKMFTNVDQQQKGLNQKYLSLLDALRQNGNKTLVQHEMR